jgi:hypothetical protein
MSSNVIKFNLKKEVELDKEFQPINEEKISLYANCDAVSSWVAYVENYEQAKELILPENIDDLFNSSLSCDELEIFVAVLNNHSEYYFFNEVFDYEDYKNKE